MKLGFHEPLSRLYIFIKNEGNCLWYYLDDGQKRYISHNALTGTLKRLEVKEVQTNFQTELKADFEVVADRRYVLRSGVDTAFTKGMLRAIAALDDDRLKRPITIELKAGDEKGNVLVSLRDRETFEFVRCGSWENVNWELLLNQTLTRFGTPQPHLSAPQPQRTISQRQYQDLLASAKRNGYSSAGFAELLGKYGFSRGGEILQKSYPHLWAEACVRQLAQKMN
jgi:hypothetical protein